jgi:hypothetical protein
MRKAADEGFTKVSVKAFYEKESTEAVLLACDWLAEPTRWDKHLRRAAASMILSVLYGFSTITSEQNHIVEAINDFAWRIFRAGYPGAHLVEFFPWMQHVPSK